MKKATHILYNAHVLTMDKNNTETSAIALEGGCILAVGDTESLKECSDSTTVYTDLHNATVLPGFYDAHGHFFMNTDARSRRADLNSPPISSCITLDDCFARLADQVTKVAKEDWVLGYGFDDTRIAENRFPTRWELDKITTDHPIYVQHISGHLGALNSMALALSKIDRNTPDPEGGVIRRDAKGEPTGVLEESILYKNVRSIIPPQSREKQLENLARTSLHYASKGITSAVDAAVQSLHEVEAANEAARQNRLAIRILYNPYSSLVEAASHIDMAHTHITRGGIKIVADGSLQGFTGYLSRPYHTPFRGDANYCGYPRFNRKNLFAIVAEAHAQGQFLVHTNGDAATDDVLDALEEALRNNPRSGHRHMLIHAQTIREEQLDRVAQLGMSISFFTPHVYYWGDRHRDIFLGPERATRLNPMRSALERGIVISSHCDAPIVPVDSLLSIWASVNRLTSSGQVLGENQRISVLEALRAHTINPAWQNFEEERKGSLEAGKFADMVVLETNPMTCDPKIIKDIKVLATYVGGEKVFSA